MNTNQDFINRLEDRENQLYGEEEMLWDRIQSVGRSIAQLIEYAKPIPKSLLYEYEYHRKEYIAKKMEREVVKDIRRSEDRYAPIKTSNIESPIIADVMPQDAIKKRIGELRDDILCIIESSCPEDAERVMDTIDSIEILARQLKDLE